MTDDDPDDIGRSALVRALTAAATEAELVGEGAALQAFRQATRRRRRRLMAGRAGTSGAVVLLVLSGAAAAAAYTASLPTPLQHVAHGIFQEVGVPASHRHGAHAGGHHSVTASSTHSAAPRSNGFGQVNPTPSPSPSLLAHGARTPQPTHLRRHGQPQPPSTPTQTSTSTSGSGVRHHVPPLPDVPAHVAVTVSARAVHPGDVVVVSGSVTNKAGLPVGHHRVVLVERTGPKRAPHVVATGTTGPRGNVSVTSPGITASSRFVLRAGTHAVSAPRRVIVHPVVEVTTRQTHHGTLLAVHVLGGNAGDTVTVSHAGTTVRTTQLDTAGEGSVTVPNASKKKKTLVVHVAATVAHAAASRRVVLRART